MPVIFTKNLSFAYNDELVLQDVSISIGSSEIVSVIGPNGGGKTTLLKLLLGIYKPLNGDISILGTSPVNARENIGYVPQYAVFDPQFPISVMDAVLMGRIGNKGFGFFRTPDIDAAKSALKEVDVFDMRNRAFSSLSGGQRQRVLIARALASSPQILMLDEPASNMDSNSVRLFYKLLNELRSRMTILLVSHDIGVVSKIVTSVICVNKNVKVHPTGELTGDVISSLYGGDISLVHHNHVCSERGHEWNNS